MSLTDDAVRQLDDGTVSEFPDKDKDIAWHNTTGQDYEKRQFTLITNNTYRRDEEVRVIHVQHFCTEVLHVNVTDDNSA